MIENLIFLMKKRKRRIRKKSSRKYLKRGALLILLVAGALSIVPFFFSELAELFWTGIVPPKCKITERFICDSETGNASINTESDAKNYLLLYLKEKNVSSVSEFAEKYGEKYCFYPLAGIRMLNKTAGKNTTDISCKRSAKNKFTCKITETFVACPQLNKRSSCILVYEIFVYGDGRISYLLPRPC